MPLDSHDIRHIAMLLLKCELAICLSPPKWILFNIFETP